MGLRRGALPLVALLAAAVLVVVAAGCGGGGSKSSGGDARAEALSYMPADPPLAIEISTDPNGTPVKNALAALRRVPFSDQFLQGARSSLESGGLSYDKDIKPLLGNPFVLATANLAGLNSGKFVGAGVATDAKKLNAVITKLATKIGSQSGFDLYRAKKDAATYLAENGATLLIADKPADLKTEIARHQAKSGLTTAAADKLLQGLPSDVFARIYGDVAPLVAQGANAQAKRVPFVNALKSYGFVLTATSSGLSAQFRVDTSNASLPENEQPLAPGSQAAPVTSVGPIDAGLRDLAHTLDYSEHLAQLLAPAGYAQFTQALQVLGKQTGIDVQKDFVDQLGDAGVATDTQHFEVRAQAKDADTLKHALVKLAPVVPEFLRGAGLPGLKLGAGPGGLTLLGRGGSYVAAYGVVGDELVFGNATPAQLTAFAQGKAASVAGGGGAVGLRANTAQLVNLIYQDAARQQLPSVAGLFLSHLGTTTGSVQESAGALTGKFTLPIR